MALCNVPVSLGELYDKYSILEIKFNKIQNIELKDMKYSNSPSKKSLFKTPREIKFNF